MNYLSSQNCLWLPWKITFTWCVSVFVGISIKIINTQIVLYRLKGTFHINYMNKSKEYFNQTN